MNLLKIFLIFFFMSFLLTNCTKKEKTSFIVEEDVESQMIRAFKEGYDEFKAGDALYAAKKFNEAEILFPQSMWAPRSALMAAYAYYSQAYYGDAISEAERFVNTYPKNKNIVYAHYIIGLSYYENIQDEKRNLKPLVKAKDKFKFILLNYPNTDFALDAKYKLDLIEDILASKEIYIGKYYLKKNKWIAAINRFKTVVNDYSGTVYVEEALHRLVEVHYKIGLEAEAKKYASVLGYNYKSGEWYKESYRVFNKDYEIEKKKKFKEKKKKNKKKSILKKFKSLFE